MHPGDVGRFEAALEETFSRRSRRQSKTAILGESRIISNVLWFFLFFCVCTVWYALIVLYR